MFKKSKSKTMEAFKLFKSALSETLEEIEPKEEEIKDMNELMKQYINTIYKENIVQNYS